MKLPVFTAAGRPVFEGKMMDDERYLECQSVRNDLGVFKKRLEELHNAYDNIKECTSPVLMVNEDEVTLPVPPGCLADILYMMIEVTEKVVDALQAKWDRL